MFDRFASLFLPDALGSDERGTSITDPYASEFFSRFGGQSYNGGLYRVIAASGVRSWNDLIEGAFPVFKGRVHCFAFDWLGRVFALDRQRHVQDGLGVVMFEPGTGQALEIPCNITSFHDDELCEYSDAALADNFYRQWLTAGGAQPAYNQCVGYKRPLFLGGSDTVENLELVDIDVYWTISAQLIAKLRGAPQGTSLKLSGDAAK